MMDLIRVTKSYVQGSRSTHAVRGVDLRVESGEFVSIMGPSGSGKSTLLHLLGALDTPTTGTVIFQGLNLQTMSDRQRSLLRRTRIGFIFQFFNLMPTLRAIENVALPLLLGGMRRSLALEKAGGSLENVGMSHRAEHYPEEMSGGEMQRVAIARALVSEPEAVLCDEPTGNLDSATSKEILALLRKLPEPGRRSVVMVTHDRKAAEFGDRVLHIRDGLVAHEEFLRESAPAERSQPVAS
jgi:putative ABC transport system ATP-binding protein